MKVSELLAEANEPALVVDPDKETDRKEIYAILNKAKETLGPRMASMLDMYYVDGKTYKAIGDEIGISPDRVRQVIGKAMRILRARLNMAVRGDAGHLYGYKRREDGRTIQGSHKSPAHLYKTMQGNPELKIVALNDNGTRFTVVHRDDPRPEVIYDPDYEKKLHSMERDLEDKIFAKNSIDRGAERMDQQRLQGQRWHHRAELLDNPVYRQLKKDIARLEKEIPAFKKRGNWYIDRSHKVSETEVWDKPNPKKKHKKLSPAKKAAAKARAKRAGRPYPNLIDNMWASKK